MARDFFSELESFGDNIDNLSNDLLNLGAQIVGELKANAPVDNGGLRNSIQAVVQDNTLAIEMLNYGIFQNYGVDGMQRQVADPVPEFGILQPSAGDKFGFSGDYEAIGGNLPFGVRKSIYNNGIKPQHWFNFENIVDRIEATIANTLTDI